MKEPTEVMTGKVFPEKIFRPTGLILYGVPASLIEVRDFQFKVEIVVGAENAQLAVIYGYSYEGHCYSLQKPCIVAVNGPGEPARGCGYEMQNTSMNTMVVDKKDKCKVVEEPAQYCMWRADKLTKTYEISITSGFIEDVILQQNIGGPKPPVAYGARVQLAHRGGKLTE